MKDCILLLFPKKGNLGRSMTLTALYLEKSEWLLEKQSTISQILNH